MNLTNFRKKTLFMYYEMHFTRRVIDGGKMAIHQLLSAELV